MLHRPRTPATQLQSIVEQAAHRSLIVEAEAVRDSGTAVALIEPGPEDLVAMGLNLMSVKGCHLVFEAALRNVTKQLRSMPRLAHGGPIGHRS